MKKNFSLANYSTPEIPTWCPGCGDFGIITALKKSFVELQIDPDNTVIVSGIGCGSLLPYWVKTYGACTLHGRAIPFATGVKLANHDLNIIVNIGDGDGLGIGMGHFAHFFRRNLNITVLLDNNGVYGLTKGQTAPTATKGTKTSSTPFGAIEDYVNGLAIALQMGATFVARAYSADIKGLQEIIKKSIAHKGAAFIDILQPCVTFNKVETYEFYNKRIKKNDLEKPLANSRIEAIEFVNTNREEIPLGIIYEEKNSCYEDQLPQLQNSSLVHQDISQISVKNFLKKRT